MANTTIQLKYSSATSAPTTLLPGEAAYSLLSNKLFIGNTTNGVLTIGGKYYTDIVDAATSAATPSTLVIRDAEGSINANVVYANIVGTIVGNAATASKLLTARDIGLAGDATGNVSFDGSQNVTLTVDLSNTGVTAGRYGGTTQIPTFEVDEEGRLTSAGNVAISTTLSFAADGATSGSVELNGGTLTITGRDGITTTAVDANNTVLIDVDNTVIRTTGNQSIGGDLTIGGNLNVQGNTVTYGVESYIVDDPIVLYANTNVSNVVDIGFVAHYSTDSGTTIRHTGLVKDVSANKYYLFDNYIPHIQEDHLLDPEHASFALANLQSNIVGGSITGVSISSLTTDLAVADGGTGASTFTSGQILVGNGTGALQSLANTGTAGTYGAVDRTLTITTDTYGRVSSVTNSAISLAASQITSGLVAIARGGTNNDTYSTGQMLIYDGSKVASLANSTFTQTGTLATSNTTTALTVDAYGRVTAATSDAISIAASQITSGTLGVARGGTGSASFAVKGVIVSDQSSTTGALSALTSSTEGHVLQINNVGVPVFGMLSGGTF
jgi:hypothetical protein